MTSISHINNNVIPFKGETISDNKTSQVCSSNNQGECADSFENSKGKEKDSMSSNKIKNWALSFFGISAGLYFVVSGVKDIVSGFKK